MCSLYRLRNRYNSLRYPGRDYSLPGKYFVTICTQRMEEWFGKVINDKMQLSETGRIASQLWYEIPIHFSFIELDEFMVMPNHVHGIVTINRSIEKTVVGALHATPLLSPAKTILKNETMSSISPKPGSLSVVVRSYKSAVTKHVHMFNSDFAWQARFYDSIICTSGQLSRMRKYILNNPQTWNNNNQNHYPR